MKKIILLYLTICLSFPAICMEVPPTVGDELFEAIKVGNIKKVKELIDKGIDVTLPRMYQGKAQIPIFFAIEQGQNEIVLLLHVAEEELATKKFFNALNKGDIETIKNLIQNNEVPIYVIKNTLKIAIEKNYTPIIQILINNVESDDIQEAFRLAINTKNLQTINTVLDNTLTIHIDQPDDNGDTPLILAIKTHDINIIKTILAEVPNPNIKKNEVLKLAKTEQEKELMKIAQAQFNLFNAIKENRSNLANFITPEVLTAHILSIERNPLAAAISKDLNTIKFIIETAESKINKDFVKNFINKTLRGGVTPLLIAIAAENTDIVDFLLKNGANPNTPPDIFLNNTPLLLAIKKNNAKIIKLLLENEKNKANINYQTPSDNITLLMLAAAQADVNTLKRLLELGADPSLQNSEGKTALDFAQELHDNISDEDIKNSYVEIIALLKEKMPIIPPTNQLLIQVFHKFTQTLKGVAKLLKK